MKCPKCGTELPDRARFCSSCGYRTDSINEQQQQTADTPSSEPTSTNVQDRIANSSSDNSAKSKIKALWKKMSLFSRVATIAIIIVIILLIVAICTNNVFAIVFSAIQIAGLLTAVLMNKGVIKLSKSWIKYIVLVVSILFTALNIWSYSWGKESKPTDKLITSQPMTSDTFNSPDIPVDTSPDIPVDTSANISVDASPDIPVDTSANVPLGSKECADKDYEVIQNSLKSAGFSNIKTEAVEDLKSTEADKLNTIISITINGKADFEQGTKFDKDDEVIIRYHVYKKCNVKVKIEFPSNLIFSKYDVKFYVGYSEMGTMKHGTGSEYELSLEPKEYTLTFENAEDVNVKGEVKLMVDYDLEASYKISCYYDEVTVETIYVDKEVELSDNEVKLDVAASEYEYKNYEEVKNALEKLGFTNIKLEILYDIVLGWTENGEVESVSIAGNQDFKRGDVFAKDSEIIITYHMPEADDPSNITMPKSDTSYIGINYLDAEKAFRDLGFSNIEVEEYTTDDTSYTDGEVYSVKIDGWTFQEGDTFKPDKEVNIKYYSVEEPEPNLTVDNCPELAEMLANKAEIDPSYSSFATKYSGKIIEFDGRIDYCTKHGNYNTRFDYLVSAGDYDPDHQIGPYFKFEDVNYSDLNTDLDTVSVGLNVRIVAKVVSFDSNSGLFYLDPISVTGR